LNEQWAKGHVRLASAYIALGGHSNDACNALQRALSLDPSNANARQMLISELRRERTTRTPEPSAPGEDDVFPNRNPPNAPNNTPNSTSSNEINNDIDYETSSWFEKVQFWFQRALHWYRNEASENTRTAINVAVVILVLYVAFGGRFGLCGFTQENAGNYEDGNAYARYHSGYYQRQQDHYNSNQFHKYKSRDNLDPLLFATYSQQTSYSRASSSGSFFPMLVIGGIMFWLHSTGLVPFHQLTRLLRPRHRRRGLFGGGLGGYGFGGLGGYGFGPPPVFVRRGRWY